MKYISLLSSLLTATIASPLSAIGPSQCSCGPVVCPPNLIAECECQNAAAQACYDSYISQGLPCASPTPIICRAIAARAGEEASTSASAPTPLPTSTLGQQSCGGALGLACPPGLTCINDPSVNCDPAQGGKECPGICVATPPPNPGPGTKSCGGALGLDCPPGLKCVDDPTVDCDPAHGAKECPGICVAASF